LSQPRERGNTRLHRINNVQIALNFLTHKRVGRLLTDAVCHSAAFLIIALSALTLPVGRQEEHPACKKLIDEVLAWVSVWSEVQMICIWSS